MSEPSPTSSSSNIFLGPLGASRPVRPALVAALLASLTVLSATGCRLAANGQNATGVKMFQAGQYQAAMQQFQSALARDPKNADAYYNLASTMHRLGTSQRDQKLLKQAETLYNQCLDRDENHVDCYRGLAVLLVETGRSDKAFTLLKNWGIRNPDKAAPRIELARLYDEFGDKQSAQRQLEYAISLDPKDPRLLMALGHLREESGDYRQALTNYERALQLNPQQPALAQRIASLRGNLGINAPVSAAGSQMAQGAWSPPRY